MMKISLRERIKLLRICKKWLLEQDCQRFEKYGIKCYGKCKSFSIFKI